MEKLQFPHQPWDEPRSEWEDAYFASLSLPGCNGVYIAALREKVAAVASELGIERVSIKELQLFYSPDLPLIKRDSTPPDARFNLVFKTAAERDRFETHIKAWLELSNADVDALVAEPQTE